MPEEFREGRAGAEQRRACRQGTFRQDHRRETSITLELLDLGQSLCRSATNFSVSAINRLMRMRFSSMSTVSAAEVPVTMGFSTGRTPSE